MVFPFREIFGILDPGNKIQLDRPSGSRLFILTYSLPTRTGQRLNSCPEPIDVVLREENAQLPVQPLHVLLAVPRSAGPVAPDRWEHLQSSDAGFHVRDFVFRVFGSGGCFLV